jgi:hypothetical protein
MIVDSRDGTIVRGADGVLYVVSADTCRSVVQDPETASPSGNMPTDVRCTAPENDYASARPFVDPGDHAGA